MREKAIERKTEKIKSILVLTIILVVLLTITSISLNFISAVGFSPTSIELELLPNEEGCGNISVNSESETIAVSDNWAENSSVEWKVSLFNTSASELGLTLTYDKSLSANEREAEICITGEKLGEYHGVLLLREEQEGNSIIQMGIWLKINIVEKKTPPPEPVSAPVTNPNPGSGGGGGGGGGGVVKPANVTTNTNSTQNSSAQVAININKNSEEDLENNENSGLTGAVIDGQSGEGKLRRASVVLVVIAILAIGTILFLYNNINKRK